MKNYPFKLQIKRTSRKNSIALRVENDLVKILAPHNAKNKDIEQLIDKNLAWITQKLAIASATAINLQKTYNSGEQWDFFGRKQILSIETAPVDSVTLDLENQKLIVYLADNSSRSINSQIVAKKLVQYFAYNELKNICENLSIKYSQRLNVEFEQIFIKSYKSVWGMCKLNSLYFNANLIFAPKWVIEYVVVHEVSHLRYKNHQSEFWQLVASLYPQYKVAKQWLKIKGEQLIHRQL